MAVLEASRLRPSRRVRWARLVAVVLLAVGGLLAARDLLHRGEVMPGVRMLGADLSGLSGDAAGLAIRSSVAARLKEPVTLSVRGGAVSVVPAKLFLLDREATAAAALEAGRESWTARARSLLSPLTGPREVRPRLVPREAAARRLEAALRPFSTPAVSASVSLRGLEPVVTSGRAGSRAEIASLLAAVEARAAAGGAGAIPVAFEEAPPLVSVDGARKAADEARLLLSAPVRLTVGGKAAGALPRAQLARLLTFTEHDGRLLVLFDEEALAKVLGPRAAPFQRRAVNATFAVDGERARVVPGRPGLGLDAGGAVVAVTTAAHRREARTAELPLTAVPPELTTAAASALGIAERVSSFTTEMGPSSANRIHNVHLMADYIDGTIVRPGERFSFNERVGPRTEERGFLEGQMIVGSLLVPSVGGGVCQTATTLFNNAFELGLPIVQRVNHSFYISHYPVGRDATVAWGGPDFIFVNDLEHALLIKASYTDDTLTFTFYGTGEGREVTASTSERTNVTQPGKTYALDPAAPRGSMRVVRGSRQTGFDVIVHRTVTKGGKTIRQDSFTSRYVPVGDTEVYGPGRAIPGSYFVIPPT